MKPAALARPVALALGVVAATTLSFLALRSETTPEAPDASVASTEKRGRRAAFLLLEGLGFAPRAWVQRPGLLPRGPHVLFLPGEPEVEPDDPGGGEAAESAGDEHDPLRIARARGLGSARHYRAFVEQGGTLVVPWGTRRDFLVDEAGFDELRGVALAEEDVSASRALLAGGEHLALEWEAPALEVGEEARADLAPLVASEAGESLALEARIGAGRVVLFASDEFLDNEALGAADHGRLLVRLVERFRPADGGGLVLFDEHALGLGELGGPLDLAFAPRHRALSLHLVLALALVAWRAAWPREFPRDPEPLEQLSPLARARAEAGLFARARRVDVLAERLRAHELRRLASILRVRIAPDPAERPAREARSEDLERLADEAGGRIDRERWREALVEREVSTLAELERLDRDLRALEAELARRDPRELEPELARRETPAGEAELTRRASPAGGRANGEEASEERGA